VRAATIVDGGRLEVRSHADPEPGTGEVLVRVRAAGLNNADLIQVRGAYPAPAGSPQDIPGLELAGDIVAVGRDALRFRVGDRVMAVVGGGAQAELCIVHERCAIPVPDGVAWEAAGGFPEAYTTAHDALFTQCALAMGERVLVHGAAGGVGVAGVQLALAAGASVVATVRDPARRDDVAALGPPDRLDVCAPGDFAGRGPFDVVLELVGAPNMAANLDALATGGRIVVIGVGGGAVADVNLLALMGHRARISGSTLRARPLEGKADAARAVERSVLPLLADGRVRVPVQQTFALDDVVAAYDAFAAGGKFGKLVVTP
jgi:NADPH:quinone reductase-like Zn-dependent oxidoreductase